MTAKGCACAPHEAPPFDVAAVRSQFPLIAAGQAASPPLVYLDSAATTHKPECVLAVQDGYYRTANANTGRGIYPLAQSSTRAYEGAREAVAEFIGCGAEETVFTAGATAALNLVAFSLGTSCLGPGDEVVLSMAEHHSNLVPWQHVARQTGANVVYLLPDEDGGISDEEIGRRIGPRTRIAAVTHVSNVLGSVFPVRRIADAVHAYGGMAVVDCAQSVAHLPVDADRLAADFLVFSGHKMFGPMGTGVLYGRRELLAGMEPFMRGGGMVADVFEQQAAFAEAPARFEAGTPNVAGALGLAEAARFLQGIGWDAVREHEQRLLGRLLAGLAALPSVRVHGAPARRGGGGGCAKGGGAGGAGRAPVVSFNVGGVDASDVAAALACNNIAIRAGALCAEPVIRYLGERSVCRVSLALYNTADEVDSFLNTLEGAKHTVSRMIMAKMH